MSWGSEAASGASNAASGASTASTAASGAGSVGAGFSSTPLASTYSQMADVGGNAASQAPSGFSAAMGNGTGPTVANANLQTYGTATPSMMQQAGHMAESAYDGLQKFQKGGEMNLPTAWRTKAWDNPGTYGYLAAKLQGMGGGGRPTAPTMVTNVSYQQPENEYLRKRGY